MMQSPWHPEWQRPQSVAGLVASSVSIEDSEKMKRGRVRLKTEKKSQLLKIIFMASKKVKFK